MKRNAFLLCLVCLVMGMMTSCSDSGSKTDNPFIIEPPYEPMFQFDEQGVPFRFEHPNLSPEMQQDLKKEAIGYGWKWMQTHEILADGHVEPKGYYEDLVGVGPSHYYIKSDTELIEYFFADHIPASAFLSRGFTMDAVTGTLSDGDNPLGIRPWTFFLRVWSIYQLDGRWYMTTIEPLGRRSDGNGGLKMVWGCSQYYRMNDAELKKIQETHTFDYSQVN